MVVTPAGMVMPVRLLQFLNVELVPRLVTPSGMVILARLLQFSKAE